MGQCIYKPNEKDHSHFTYNDPNSPPLASHTKDTIKEVTEAWHIKPEEAGLRIITPSYHPLCTMG